MFKLFKYKEYNEKQIEYQYKANVLIDTVKPKYINILSHFTTDKYLKEILKSNTLLAGKPYDNEKSGAVSLTRNYKIPNTLKSLNFTCKINLNSLLLSKDFKIEPYLYHPPDKSTSLECIDELEERIIGDIKNLDKYIISIDVTNDNIYKYLKKKYSNLNIKKVIKL